MKFFATSEIFKPAERAYLSASSIVNPKIADWSNLASCCPDLDYIYSPIIMPTDMRVDYKPASRVDKRKRLVIWNDYLDYSVFNANDVAKSIIEYLRGLSESAKLFLELGYSRLEVAEYERLLAHIAAQSGQSQT